MLGITTPSSTSLEPYIIHNPTKGAMPLGPWNLAKPRSGVGPASQAPWYGNVQSGHEVHISTEGQSCALSALSVANLHLDHEEVTPYFLLHFGRCNGSQAVAGWCFWLMILVFSKPQKRYKSNSARYNCKEVRVYLFWGITISYKSCLGRCFAWDFPRVGLPPRPLPLRWH